MAMLLQSFSLLILDCSRESVRVLAQYQSVPVLLLIHGPGAKMSPARF